MLLIAHRGNLRGPIPDLENRPEQLERALGMGVWVEADLWREGDSWLLGHEPTYPVTLAQLDRKGVILHLKSPHAPPVENADYFCLGNDRFSITWAGMFWVNYGMPPLEHYGLMCAPELVGAHEPLYDFVMRCYDAGVAGICTDYPLAVREMLK